MAENANIIDDYELISSVATGNTTQIWEAKNIQNGQAYALKILFDEYLKDAEAKASLKHEYNVAKSLEHPSIIQVYDLRISKLHAYFTMEYFRAPNLKAMLRNDLPGVQARAEKLMECLVQALMAVHRKGWIHRDVKPENVLLSKGGEARLIDFSLASR
ncbi:MAG: protein kinase, partial [Planctomycetaceae bacterium]|nr:protein kinase [Planctomycetaceae bacterium]